MVKITYKKSEDCGWPYYILVNLFFLSPLGCIFIALIEFLLCAFIVIITGLFIGIYPFDLQPTNSYCHSSSIFRVVILINYFLSFIYLFFLTSGLKIVIKEYKNGIFLIHTVSFFHAF